jgi:Spy/CpxP family protein refolding chaperone
MFKILIRLFLATTLISLGLETNLVSAESINSPNFNRYPEYLAQRRRGNFKGFGNERLVEKLNLSNEQKEQMQQIRQKYQPTLSQLRENLNSERQKLREIMASNESISNIRSQHQKIISLDQELHKLRFESVLEMRQVLTPEQRQTFANLMNQRRAKGSNR